MTAGSATFMRRWIGAVTVLASLIATTPTRTAAQQAQDTPAVLDKIVHLTFSGRNLDAVELATRLFEAAPLSERQNAFQFAAYVCATTLDVECARDLASHDSIKTLAPSDAQPLTVGYGILLWSYNEIMAGNYQSTAYVLDSGFPITLVNAVRDPVLFAELQLLAAKRSRLVFDFEASRDHLDKALVTTLSLRNERLDASRLIVRIAGQLLENFDVERALRLAAAADPLLQTIPPDSFLAYEFLQLRAALLGYRKDFAGASNDLRLSLTKLDRLQLRAPFKSALKSATYNSLLGLEVLRGDHDAARDLLQSHPLMDAKPAILQRGYFADANEFNFALAEEFVRLILADPTDTGWGDLMKMPPRWTTDPERIQEVRAFGQAAAGFQLAKAGKKEEARRELIEAAKQRLKTLQDQYRKSVYASPLPGWPDLILAEFAIAATLSDATPDYDLVLQAHVLLNRSLESSPDDALTSQAIQASDERKRIAQGLRTIQYQQAGWEKAELAALTRRLSSSVGGSTEALARDRQRILYSGNNFILHQQRMRAALLDRAGTDSVDSVTSLAALKQLLSPDEALVFHVPIFDRVGKICIRAEQTKSSTQEIDTAAVTDARLVRAALTATHPASNEADSQFPAIEAVRTGKLVFGGLEDCLRRSQRIYLVASSGVLAQVPPAALLTEVPPAMGAGFDLRAAHWMIRDHSFVRTTSINAFVATKRLSKTKRATLDYLGVGDPVLAPRNPATPSGGEFVARGSMPVQTGTLNSLPELPETSDELQRVASLFDKSKVRVLRRDAASEEEFRLQPLSEFDIVHFATHGLVKEEQPGLQEPSLVLTPNPEGDAFNDGLLTASQIAALPLKVRLVVLSACNSARYEPSIIDSGIQGLSTSFAIAGAPSMIASLWPIESSLTRDLIIGTFRAARGGNVAIADALAMAVRRHLDGPTARPLLHPRFWAALVVLGDGSMSLNASAEKVRRDLGPFSSVDSLDRAEILSGASLGKDFVTSTMGGWNGKRFASLVRRQAVDGTTKWEVKDQEIAAGPVIAGEQVIYAGGFLSLPSGASTVTVPVLRALQPDGKVSWSQRFQGPHEDNTTVMGLAVAQDQSAVALVGPIFGQKTETDFSLVRVDINGREIARAPISLPAYGQSTNSGYLSIDNGTGLMVINRAAWAKSDSNAYRLNGLGDTERCWEGDAADIALVDLPEFKERKRLRIDRFRVRSSVAAGNGWTLVGDASDDCGLEKHAVAYTIRNDGSVEQIWRDASPFETSARGVRKVDGIIEIVGYAERSVAIREEVPVVKALDFSSKRSGNEAYISGEAFSVRLSERGIEERRDFVGAGFPIVPSGMASTSDHSVIFGTVGSRPLWMAHYSRLANVVTDPRSPDKPQR
jgi:CHAT domain-containing protein